MLKLDTRRFADPLGVAPVAAAVVLASDTDGKNIRSDACAGDTASGEPAAVNANDRAEPRAARTLPTGRDSATAARTKLFTGLRELSADIVLVRCCRIAALTTDAMLGKPQGVAVMRRRL